MRFKPRRVAWATLVLLAAIAAPGMTRESRESVAQAIDAAYAELFSSDQTTTLPARGSVEVAFSPDGGCTDATVRFVGEARNSIRMAAYGLTSNPIGKALVDAKKRGVEVRVVVDRDHNGRRNTPNSIVSYLAANGIPVRIDSAVKIQHNKVLIVDGISVQNGSFNFTRAAQTSNAENIIIHRDFPELAALFTRNWERLWAESADYEPGY